MEILVLLAIGLLSFAILVKLLALVFRVGLALLVLPLKILLGLGIALFSAFFVVPLAIAAGIFSLAITPFVLLVPFLPLLLIAAGIWLILRSR